MLSFLLVSKVIVLGLMVWIVKRVRTNAPNTNTEQQNIQMMETNIEANPIGSFQVLQQPLMMSCSVMEPSEYKQALELDHYVIA